ncbi:hypothetical protein [Paenibacillus xylanilyticus]|uniref:hypothetical protein n=1 Tax=Paenibacillus xylanilyticus TaxID=248903 RepID=UPI003AAA46F8
MSVRTKWVLLALTFCLLLLPWLFKWFSAEEKKATWLWDASIIAEQTPDIISFSKEQGVDVIFLQMQDEVSDETYRKFIASARQAEIQVHALNGHADWAYRDKQEEGLAFVDKVTAYNEASAPEERFTGIQFDVEPYQLRRWEQEQSEVIAEWQDNMSVWTSVGQEAGLYMSAAIPFWLDAREATNGGGSLSRWIIASFDAVAIMAYRDSGQQMYDLSKEELAEADELDKKVWIGAELGDTHEGEHLTFYNKTVGNMDEEIAKVFSLGTEHSSFAGVAIHHYQAWYAKKNGIPLAKGNAGKNASQSNQHE